MSDGVNETAASAEAKTASTGQEAPQSFVALALGSVDVAIDDANAAERQSHKALRRLLAGTRGLGLGGGYRLVHAIAPFEVVSADRLKAGRRYIIALPARIPASPREGITRECANGTKLF